MQINIARFKSIITTALRSACSENAISEGNYAYALEQLQLIDDKIKETENGNQEEV